MKNIRTRKIIRIRGGKSSKVEDGIILDTFLNVLVNGEHIASFVCLPGDEDKAAIGYLFSSGILKSINKIKEISHSSYKVNVQTSEQFINSELKKTLITSDCVIPEKWIKLRKGLSLSKVHSNLMVESTSITNAKKQLDKACVTYRKTGGTHAAALFTQKGSKICSVEDISRHVAVDKIVGTGLLEKINLNEVFLITTGRIASITVAKAVNLQIPIVASISAPMNSGVELAEKLGITLIGFVRGNRMNIYTHPERIHVEGELLDC